jgi:hypothetical protein
VSIIDNHKIVVNLKKNEMKTPQEIAFKIYFLLKEKPHSVTDLHLRLQKYDIQLSKRSIYRYLEKIETSLNTEEENIEVEMVDKNKKIFFVKSNSKDIKLTQGDWVNFINSNYIFQSNYKFSEEQQEINSKILSLIKSKAPIKSQLISNLNADNAFYESTGFGELIMNNKYKKNLFKLIYYYSNQCDVKITKYSDSVINNQEIPKINTPLIPYKIWYHRGNYSISLYSSIQKKAYTIEIDMIDSINYHSKHPKNIVIKELDELMSFGYHPSIVDGIQQIVLQFPSNPGEHIMNRFWHKSQRFEKLNDGTVLMYITTNINIEVIGWISMWLDNVKIIQPTSLKTYFEEKLNNMLLINANLLNPVNNG